MCTFSMDRSPLTLWRVALLLTLALQTEMSPLVVLAESSSVRRPESVMSPLVDLTAMLLP